MKISVNVPSYKRSERVKTAEYLPYAKVWVDCKEYDDYKRNNPDFNIIACPEGVQGNLCRVRNYIMKQEFDNGADVVLILDDDYYKIGRFDFNADENWAYEEHYLDADEVLIMVEKYSIMANDLGAKFWGLNCGGDRWNYRHDTPFSTRSYIGGPFQCFLKGNRCWYDEQFYLKQDFDMTLQQLNLERVVLRVNSHHYYCNQSTNKGGLAAFRNREREYEETMALQKKWGTQIVKFDDTNKGHSLKERIFDYNPIIRIPIKGV